MPHGQRWFGRLTHEEVMQPSPGAALLSRSRQTICGLTGTIKSLQHGKGAGDAIIQTVAIRAGVLGFAQPTVA